MTATVPRRYVSALLAALSSLGWRSPALANAFAATSSIATTAALTE